jgi:hypothetical protein
VTAVLKIFPWDVWVALAISVMAFLAAVYFDLSPVLAFILILFALCGYVVLQNRLDGRSF